MLRIAILSLVLIFSASQISGPAKAASSKFDGSYELEVGEGCVTWGANFPAGHYDAVIENGLLTGQFELTGSTVNVNTLKARVDDDGKLRDGKLGFRNFRGRIDGTSGKGNISFRGCFADWTLTLIEPAREAPPQEQQTVTVSASPAADDAPPVIEAPGSLQTDGPVIELTGQVSDSSAIVEFTVNGAAASLQADGGFFIKRGVAQGQSELVIAALDEWGNRAERRQRKRNAERQ